MFAPALVETLDIALPLPLPLLLIVVGYDNDANEELKRKAVAELMAFRELYFWSVQSRPGYRRFKIRDIITISKNLAPRRENNESAFVGFRSHFKQCLEWFAKNPASNGLSRLECNSVVGFDDFKRWHDELETNVKVTCEDRNFLDSIFLDGTEFWRVYPDGMYDDVSLFT